MFDPDVDPVTGLPADEAVDVELLASDLTEAQQTFLAELAAAELAGLNAPEPEVSPWAATEAIGARARTAEALTRKAQAVGLREVHALFGQVLADDAAFCGATRPQALEFAADEIASVLGVSRRTAQIRIDDALHLVGSCPRTLALLEAGVLAYPAARALAGEACRAPQELRAVVESRVLDALGHGEVDGLGSMSSEEVVMAETLHPQALWRVGQAATRGRVIQLVREAIAELSAELPEAEQPSPPADVEAFPTRPGQMMLGAEVSDADGTTALANIQRLARLLKLSDGETRSMGQLRRQAFIDLLHGTLPPVATATGSGQPDCGPIQATPSAAAFDVHLTVDGAGRLATPRYGPLAPEALAQILQRCQLSGGTVRVRSVPASSCAGGHVAPTTDPHDPSLSLAAAVRLRDRRCRFPGCTVPAGRCDLDHSRPWPHGPTCSCNLSALCRHHHRLKTHGRWGVTNHGDGHVTWTTPTGRTLQSRPDP